MLQISNLSKQFSGKTLFSDISFTIEPSQRVGLVGRNGSGKSTLFKLILNQIPKDQGEVQIPKDYSLGHLAQFMDFTQPNLLEECVLSLKESEKTLVYKAEKILTGLGFTEDDFKKDPKSFSGGMQLRINLCKCLLTEPSMLLLDEPTNYLDIDGIRWLKMFLRKYPGEVFLITHDRSFMDDVVTHIVGIHRGKTHKVKGDSEKYYTYISNQDEIYENTRINQEKKRKETLEFVDKFRSKARQASLAQSRLKMLDKMEEMKVLPRIPLMSFKFNQKGFNAKTMVTAKDLSFGYHRDQKLFKNLDFTVDHQDRIAIMGANGKGKSTLLKILSKDLEGESSEFKIHRNASIGFFGQTNIERLHSDNTITQEIKNDFDQLADQTVRSLCGAMLFSGDDALKKIKVLSGGEKSRVMLAKILAKPCNLLLLDEPTNHFDQESIEILINELQKFDGAIVFVTHSEYFAKSLATKMIVFNKEKCLYHPLNYQEFLARHGWDNNEPTAEVKSSKNSKDYKELKKMKAEIIKARSKDLKPLKEEFQNLEDSIHKLELSLNEDQEKLILASETGDAQNISKLSKDIGIKEKAIVEMFEKLETVDLELRTKEDSYQAQIDQLNLE